MKYVDSFRNWKKKVKKEKKKGERKNVNGSRERKLNKQESKVKWKCNLQKGAMRV